MKNLISIVFIFLFTLGTIQSQNYYMLPDSNATWIVQSVNSNGWGYWGYNIGTDTIIDSISYNTVYYGTSANYYLGAYRNDVNGKIYYRPAFPSADSVEYLLFDFSANTGDTIRGVAMHMIGIFVGIYDLFVDSTGYTESNPYSFKYLYLSPIPPFPPQYANGNPVVWVEMIGCLNGGVFNEYLCGLDMITLRCMSVNDTTMYFNPSCNCFFTEGITIVYEQGTCVLPPVHIEESLSNNPIISAYPNPFTTSTTIKYEITEPSHVQITIYNAIGESIQEPVNRLMPQGKHTFTWSAERLPEGLYYAVLRSEEGMSVVKMIKQ